MGERVLSPETLLKNRERSREWYLENKERASATHREWYRKNRDHVLQKIKEYQLKDPEKYKEIRRKARRNYTVRHPERVREYNREKRKAVRLKALLAVGRGNLRCSNCACSEVSLLEINHLKGGGRHEFGKYKEGFYRRIASGQRPVDDLNLLCKVCNALHAVHLNKPQLAKRFTITWSR